MCIRDRADTSGLWMGSGSRQPLQFLAGGIEHVHPLLAQFRIGIDRLIDDRDFHYRWRRRTHGFAPFPQAVPVFRTGAFFLNTLSDRGPVSYTHLDVYKRQL